MDDDFSQFKQDLADPEAGISSDIHQAILPIIGTPTNKEHQNIAKLREDVRKGIVGLEYLTGNRHNTGETFYDEHPIQALTTNMLGKSPLLGLGLAGSGVLLNSVRQKQNLDKTIPASMARRGNTPQQDLSHPAALLNPEKGTIRADIAKIYGTPDSIERMAIIDRLSGISPGAIDSFSKEYNNLQNAINKATTGRADAEKKLISQLNSLKPGEKQKAELIKTKLKALKDYHAGVMEDLAKKQKTFLERARKSSGYSHLESNVNLHEALRRAKQKGGFSAPLGSGLELPGRLSELNLDKNQGIVDLVEHLKKTKADQGFDQDLLLKSVEDFFEGDSAKLENFKKHSLPKLTDTAHQKSGLKRFLSRHKLPLAAGAATAVGGTGLYYLLKALQDRMYSKDKIKKWKKTLLKSRGDFDAANQIQ